MSRAILTSRIEDRNTHKTFAAALDNAYNQFLFRVIATKTIARDSTTPYDANKSHFAIRTNRQVWASLPL